MTEAAWPEPTALYRVFGDGGLLLYIGISDDFGRRWRQHAKLQPWWPERRSMTVHWLESREEAEAAERTAIKAEHPKYNKKRYTTVPPPLKLPPAAMRAIPPSMPGSANREALIAQLIDLRIAAGLSGNALAGKMRGPGNRPVAQSRVWKIEHDELLPNAHDIEEWTRVTGRPDLAGKLLARLAAARSEQMFARDFGRPGGAAAYQDHLRALEASATRIGWFEVAMIPGILQTVDYARHMMLIASQLHVRGACAAAIDAAVTARIRRQEVLHDRSKHVQVVLGESALRTLLVTPEAQAAQLGKLLSALQMPTVEVGVIGLDQPMPVYPPSPFRLLDNELVITETMADERQYAVAEKPEQVAAFVTAFEQLRQAASYGGDAAAIIRQVLDDLRRTGG